MHDVICPYFTYCLAASSFGITVLRAIGKVFASDLSLTSTDSSRLLKTASTSAIIRRRFHPLGRRAALHSIARGKVERVLLQVLKFLGSNIKELIQKLYDMDEEDMETIEDFAECIDPTELFDCSTPTINQFRTIDGTCNNLQHPLVGASNTAFR